LRNHLATSSSARLPLRLFGCATKPYPTTSLTPAFRGGQPTPDANFLVPDCVFQTVDAHGTFDAVRLGFNDEASHAFLKEQVA
jgi:hypothetical protein